MRLEASIAASAQEIATREKEVERLIEIADRAESFSAESLERKKKSRTSHFNHTMFSECV